MQTISVPWSTSGKAPKARAELTSAPRKDVPVLRVFGGLALTPTTGMQPGFTITHVATGMAVPSLVGLSYQTAVDLAELLAMSFPWHKARDAFFFRTMSAEHQAALRGCIVALREMFGVES